MKKFNPQHWKVLKNGQAFEHQGRLLLRSKAQIAVTVTDAFGCEALAGIGYEVKSDFASPSLVMVETLTGEEDIFYYSPTREPIPSTGEIFTNVDRKPMESGALLEVKKALRELELKKRGMVAEVREAARQAAREAASVTAPAAPVEVPEPEPEPAPVDDEPDAE